EEATPATVQEGSAEASDSLEVISTDAASADASGLLTAERVVGVGLGIGGKENLSLIDDLADALGAAVACTLPLCDNYRWFEHSSVVGTSTQKISPRLYVACGSSGAPQHLAGVRGAKVIVAINNDPEAPIFRECSYGIVGDVVKVLPVITEAIKEA
ncbi:MAG: electron transfer flavoprotein subunit alpha/FixB family protein, partial [Eggerthellaceae bacterium]|nr:electron transfer flavoprotein subunit alpha/FixB family protein [Eggerthellaceae bacterium]